METIFDHNPTPKELNKLIGNMSKEDYLWELEAYCPKGENLLFIALLYEKRGDLTNFEKYRNQVPDLYKEWKLGLDYVMVPVD